MRLSAWFFLWLSATAFTFSAGKQVIHIAHDTQVDSPVHRAMLRFKAALEKDPSLGLQVKILPARQLGDVYETTMLVQQGNIQMTFGASLLLTTFIPELYALDKFFLFKDFNDAKMILTHPAFHAHVFPALDRKGFKGLGVMAAGFRVVSNNRLPLKTFEDFKKLKIRAAATALQMKTWESMGAYPVSLTLGEVFLSLQQGLINAQEASCFSTYHERFYEAQTDLTLTNHTFTNYVVFMQKVFFERLTYKQQRAIEDAVTQAIEMQWAEAKLAEDKSLASLKQSGLRVIEPSKSLINDMDKAYRQQVEPLLVERTGERFYHATHSLIDQIRLGKL